MITSFKGFLLTAGANLFGTALAALMQIWAMTWRADTRDLERLDRYLQNGDRLLAVFWHGKFFPLFALARGRQAIVVTNRSFRGNVIARICTWFGYTPVLLPKGETDERLEFLENHFKSRPPLAAMAVDGPLGPYHRVKPGAVRMSSDLAYRILPLSVVGRPCWIANRRWDKHEIPLPFAQLQLSVGEPVDVPPQLTPSDFAHWQALIRDRLEQIDTASDDGSLADDG